MMASALILSSCGGNGGSSTTAPISPPPPPPPPSSGKYTPPAAENLSVSDVEIIIAQAVAEASAQNLPSVISVTDRAGNVLAVFRMNGTTATTKIRAGKTTDIGLQGVDVPHQLAAISKAITGAYLSSGGNAFSSRTASQIVQEHFPPSANTVGLESGPLFGVQFSQLPCSDFSQRSMGGTNTLGPKRAPLGLSADPGGLPLYKNGVMVGGIGVSGDDDYGFDTEIVDIDNSLEELIAVAGTFGFAAPQSIRADRITVDGTSLRFIDKDESDLASNPASAPSFASVDGSSGNLVAVTGYYQGVSTLAGTTYKFENSGMRPSTRAEYANPDVFVFTNGSGVNRFPPIAATDGAVVTSPLTQAEVRTVIEEAFLVMTRSRAQIRKPLDSRAEVSISVVDTYGTILGMVRSPDAPIFGSDVSLQKARTATFFSNTIAGDQLEAVTRSVAIGGGGLDPRVTIRTQQVRDFIGDPNALTGTHAFADRSGGNLSRPYFPDGEVGTANGPLSVPIENFSPFANGLQEELIKDNVLEHATFVLGGGPDTRRRCTFVPDVVAGQNRLQNGIQIFPGSVPIYKNGELVGGIGVSGDGIDQDDMISFLGVHNAGLVLGTLGNADPAIRADTIIIPVNGEDIRLRYVSCPFAPFLDTNEQNPCQGK
ncbi:MAG: heme-binding protein [Robiginitomaculum sp.]|nr:heme-binding protein [Robiginitomaculum sp.]